MQALHMAQATLLPPMRSVGHLFQVIAWAKQCFGAREGLHKGG